MGYNGNNRRFKTDMFPKRETKRATNLISGMLARIISVPISACNMKPKKGNINTRTVKKTNKRIGEETLFIVIIALVGSYNCISLMIELFSDDEVLVGCILAGLFILMWICVRLQVKKYINHIHKYEDNSK